MPIKCACLKNKTLKGAVWLDTVLNRMQLEMHKIEYIFNLFLVESCIYKFQNFIQKMVEKLSLKKKKLRYGCS